ncbi:MAG: hypothetical protein ACR2FH_01720 [Caulobacteraceae bacterium]
MPILQNPRYEAFAQARVSGASLEQAYEDAGFAPDTSHACRLAKRPEVAERMAELLREQDEAEDASPRAIVAALVRMARDSEEPKTAAGVKEARLNLLEAHRLRNATEMTRTFDRATMKHNF